LTPHSLVASLEEARKMGGAHHPLLGVFGVMSAKNTVVNIMILSTFLSFLIYRRGNKGQRVPLAQQSRAAKITLVAITALAVWLLFLMQRYRAAVESYQRARGIVGKEHPLVEANLHEAEDRLDTLDVLERHPWLNALIEATTAIMAGEYPKARELYEEALAQATPEAEAHPKVRSSLATAHFNLACIHSLRSIGKSSPAAASAAIAPEAAARERDRAFEHLRRARALGIEDLAKVRQDADMTPLKADPRWQEIVGE